MNQRPRGDITQWLARVTPMDASEFARVRTVFDAAVDLAEDERDAYVRASCADDDVVREHVLRLLEADRAPADARVRSAVHAATVSFIGGAHESGHQLGPYRLIRELGRGGMATVWLAERSDDAYRASVAIKFVRGALAFPDASRRFRAERQILADLHHPHIAALLDGGETADGMPYLVMEYIEGEPITAWAETRAVPLAERLRLFQLVCEAVQHAHSQLVVHRDIKPSNILVAGAGTPKLLDFGIAKLLSPDAPSDTTALGRRLTPSYASPEQIRGERVSVTTDVYSLGVLLYELLTGSHPFASGDLSTDEVRRRVLEDEPPKPSEVLRRRPPAAIEPRQLAADLDNIVLKAMSKEPERRYGSVAAFDADIERMLIGAPVLARSPTLGYRAYKFVRRNTLAVAGVVLLFLSLVVGLGATMWQARRANRARAAAETALAQATEAKNFLASLFRASDPNENRGADITARELLRRGLTRVDSMRDHPAIQADLLETLARVEMSLGEFRPALNMFDREAAIRQANPGIGPDSMLVKSLNGRGQAYSQLGLSDSAAAAFEKAAAVGRSTIGPFHPIVVAIYNNLGITYGRLGRDTDAEAAYRSTLEGQLHSIKPDHPDRTYPLNNLGLLFVTEGRYAEAESLLRESLRIRRLADSTAPVAAYAYDNLGFMLREAGRYDEAEPLVRHALAIRIKTLGPRHRFTGESYSSLGQTLAFRGRPGGFAEADSMLHLALDVFDSTLGRAHYASAYVLLALGVLDVHRGDTRAAETWFRQALALRRRNTGDNPRETVRTLVWLSKAQRIAGDTRGETASSREADSLASARLDAADPVRSRAAIALAISLARGGDRARATAMFSRAVSALQTRVGASHPFVREACDVGRTSGLSVEGACPT